MADVVYNWERYWVPRDGAISYDLEGFPIAPGTEAARWWKTDSVGFDKLNTQPCVVFLGEPGIGKTYALRDAEKNARAARTTSGASFLVRNLGTYSSDTHLIHDVFESPEFNAWRATGGELHVFLDSFDECLFRIDPLAALIADQFERLPNVQNLFLRIASRTAEWRTSLEDALREKWGKESVGIYELVPLTREQILVAAEQQLPNAKRFLEAVIESEVVPFATKPLTLDLLFRIWGKHGGSLPSTQAEIYEQGCLELCTDPARRDTPKLRRQLSPAQRLAAASHISAAMVFCRRAAVWTGTQQATQTVSDITLAELETGSFIANGRSIPVTRQILKEALDTGIFTSRGRDRLGWAHQTFGEFLAARYLKQQEVNTCQILDLLVHPHDPEHKFVPQLQETAAWLAGTNPDIFERLLSTQANVLLRSDVSSIDSSQKAKLVDALLSAFAERSVHARDYWAIYRRYPKLRYAGLTKQLRQRVRNRSLTDEERIEAAVMADACELRALLPNLLKIALDKDEPLELRLRSATSVSRLGDAGLKARLKPLALGVAGLDPRHELKGVGLNACWPDSLSAEELFASLEAPGDRSDGLYRTFLGEKIAPRLSANDIPVALAWAESQPEEHGRHFGKFEGLTYSILEEAAKHLADENIRNAFARALLARLRKHDFFKEDEARHLNEVFKSNPGLRFDVIKAMLPHFEDPRRDAVLMTRRSLKLVGPQDLSWLLEQLSATPNAESQDNLCHLVAYTFHPDDTNRISAVIEASRTCPVLTNVMHFWLVPVEIDSEQARKAREEMLEELRWQKEAELRQQPKVHVPPPSSRIVSLLDKFEGGDLDAWWHLNHWMEVDDNGGHPDKYYHRNILELPGWQKASEITRQRLVMAAYRYVQKRDANPGEWFTQKDILYHPANAGVRALLLLANQARSVFDELPPEIWKRWIPAIVRLTYYDERDEFQVLAAKAFERAPVEATDWTMRTLNLEDAELEFLPVLHILPDHWSALLGAALLSRARQGNLKSKCASDLLTALVEHKVQGAIDFARSLIPRHPPREGENRQIPLCAARLLMQHGERRDWPRIRQVIRNAPSFGKELVEHFAYTYEQNSSPILKTLSEKDVARLYEWMVTQYPVEQDPDERGGYIGTLRHSIAHLRNSLVSHLAGLGSEEGCNVLRHLAKKFPRHIFIRRALHLSREQMRRQTWRPPTPSQLFELATSRQGRLVQSGDQLVEVVLDSIARFQGKLQGKRPLAHLLWAGDRPKPEEDLSDWLENQFNDDLTGRGIVIGREVRIHRLDRLDLRIDAVAQGPGHENYSTVQVIIEVKGCWHRELKTAMKTQLLDRYLAKNDCQHGIYLAGWFLCDAWTGKNPPRTAVKFSTRERLAQFLAKQARSLSSNEKQLHAMVLDARIELAKRKRAASHKRPLGQKRRRGTQRR